MIYVYGGLSGLEYDTTEAEAWLPYLSADMPTAVKAFDGIDAALTGTWSVSVAMQPTDPDAEDLVATLSETTYNSGRITGLGASTHLSLRFRTTEAGPATLSSTTIHYTAGPDADK
jgi:hypothetical protein